MEKNIGTAGVLYGSLQDKYIVVGGGANFPYESVLNGGAKKSYSDVYMLEDVNGKMEVVEHINLENEIGYGASVTTKDGIYYIGGSSNPEADDDILFITLKDGKLNVEKIGDLPFVFQSGIAVEKDNKIYIAIGKQGDGNSNKLYEYDLATKEIKELSPMPADARQQAVGQILNGSLYIFCGAANVAYTDGYKYDFASDAWSKLSDVSFEEEEVFTLAGGTSIKLNDKEMLVIGGVNKEIYDDAVYKLGKLKGTELANFRASYFGADPYEFNWNTEILVYNADSDSWKTLGEVPFDPPAGEGLILIGNKIYSVNGEIKPGVRTDKAYVGIINSN